MVMQMMVNDHGLFKLAYCRSLAFTRNLCTEHECEAWLQEHTQSRFTVVQIGVNL